MTNEGKKMNQKAICELKSFRKRTSEMSTPASALGNHRFISVRVLDSTSLVHTSAPSPRKTKTPSTRKHAGNLPALVVGGGFQLHHQLAIHHGHLPISDVNDPEK